MGLLVATLCNVVTTIYLVARSIPVGRSSPRGRLQSSENTSLPLIGIFILAVPLFVLLSTPIRHRKATLAPPVVLSVAPASHEGLTVTLRPRLDSLAGSRPFLAQIFAGSRSELCAKLRQCVNLRNGNLEQCPGLWSGETLSVANRPVDDAPWFFTGDYALCGRQAGGCPTDWGCDWTTTAQPHTGKQGAQIVCTTQGAPSDRCRHNIFSSAVRGGVLGSTPS